MTGKGGSTAAGGSTSGGGSGGSTAKGGSGGATGGGSGGATGGSGGATGGSGGATGGSGGATGGSGGGGTGGGGGSGGSDNSALCMEYCTDNAAICAAQFALDYPGGEAECLSSCAPWPEGGMTDTFGNTTYCRINHTDLADTEGIDPHCQHAKKTPTEGCINI